MNISSLEQNSAPRRVLFLAKNASRGGSMRILSNILAHLQHERFLPSIILPDGGDLLSDYQAHASVRVYGNERKVSLLRTIQKVCRRGVLSPAAHVARALEIRFRRQWIRRELAVARPDIIVHFYTMPEPLFENIDKTAAPSVQLMYQYAETLNRMGDIELRRFVQRAHFFFTEGIRVKEYTHDCLGIPSDRILCIPVGPNSSLREAQLQNPNRVRRTDLGIADDELIIGTCGAMQYRKGVDLWVRAADIVLRRFAGKRIRFIWIGGRESSRQSLFGQSVAKLTTELGHGHNIQFLPDQKDVYPLMELCNIYVQPSRTDPFPHTLMEAMSMSKPVVTFTEGMGSEAYAKDALLSVPITSAEALADGIARLIEHPEEQLRLGEAAGRLIQERFNMIENVRRFEEAMEQVIRIAPSRESTYD